MTNTEIINKFNLNKISEQSNEHQANDITWRVQDSNEESILFYFLEDNDESKENFLKRIKDTKYGTLVLPFKINTSLTNVYVATNWNETIFKLCEIFYPFDFSNIKVLGVTGTNGKTTTVNICQQVAMQLSIPSMSIGTLGIIKDGEVVEDFSLTSPPQIDFRKILNKYGEGIKYLFIELSSHALEQERLFGLQIDAAAWTSFSQDHLDYHNSMNSYFESKIKIINMLKNKDNLLVTYNDKTLQGMLDDRDIIYTVPKKNIQHDNKFLKVDFNQLNLDIALNLFKMVNENISDIDINKITPAPGRFNLFELKNGNIAIVDYAHTPDAIENVCRSAKNTFAKSIVTVFGCGGDRDKTKRPLMAKAAEKYSDNVIITSDNPRGEVPEKIIEDALAGITNKNKTKCITDRAVAIGYAIENNKDSIIVIAGKGHENYIIIGDEKKYYSDIDEVNRYLA